MSTEECSDAISPAVTSELAQSFLFTQGRANNQVLEPSAIPSTCAVLNKVLVPTHTSAALCPNDSCCSVSLNDLACFFGSFYTVCAFAVNRTSVKPSGLKSRMAVASDGTDATIDAALTGMLYMSVLRPLFNRSRGTDHPQRLCYTLSGSSNTPTHKFLADEFGRVQFVIYKLSLRRDARIKVYACHRVLNMSSQEVCFVAPMLVIVDDVSGKLFPHVPPRALARPDIEERVMLYNAKAAAQQQQQQQQRARKRAASNESDKDDSNHHQQQQQQQQQQQRKKQRSTLPTPPGSADSSSADSPPRHSPVTSPSF